MTDPALIAAKLTAAGTAIRAFVNGVNVTYLGVSVNVGEHVTDDQVSELAAAVVDAIDVTEDQWAASHPAKP